VACSLLLPTVTVSLWLLEDVTKSTILV
jgi:hypothetical protein